MWSWFWLFKRVVGAWWGAKGISRLRWRGAAGFEKFELHRAGFSCYCSQMMTSLDELKKKWFIDTADSGVFPPQVRHPNSLLEDHSDGNLVRPLINGVNIMGHFHDRMEQLLDVDIRASRNCRRRRRQNSKQPPATRM